MGPGPVGFEDWEPPDLRVWRSSSRLRPGVSSFELLDLPGVESSQAVNGDEGSPLVGVTGSDWHGVLVAESTPG